MSNIEEYVFRCFDDSTIGKVKIYWDTTKNIALLKDQLSFLVKLNVAKTMSYFKPFRTSKSGVANPNYKSADDLVIYDRFGSKAKFNSDISKCEFTITDVGQKHFDLKNNPVNFNEYTQTNKYCSDQTLRYIKEIEFLFPPKNYMKFK